MLRGSYQFREQLSFDMDAGYEHNTYSGPNQNAKTSRIFMSGGFRWDF
jgi:hypothetical protein